MTGTGVRHGSTLGGLITCYPGQANDLVSLWNVIIYSFRPFLRGKAKHSMRGKRGAKEAL